MTDGPIRLDEARRHAKARNQGAEPDPGFDESPPPPPTGPEDYGVDAISADESLIAPDAAPLGDPSAPLGDPYRKLPAQP